MAFKYLLFFSVVCCTYCDESNTNYTQQSIQGQLSALRKSREVGSYLGFATCAMKYDVSCFLEVAENYLEIRRMELLGEADAEALKSTGRSDPDDKPSHLANTLGRLISELVSMFRNGFSNFFKAESKDLDEADDDEGLEDNEVADITTKDSNGETREIITKKKKKKPLKSLIRLIKVALIALIIVLKLAILLKALQTAMQFKFLLISLGGFAIQAAKLWMSIKNKEHGHEEIVYKNPYSSGDEYSGPGGAHYGGEYNAARSAQELAYSLQRAM